jgi:hypothetical protein
MTETDLDSADALEYFPPSYLTELKPPPEQWMASVASPRTAVPGIVARIQDLILPVGIVASVLVILVPMPAHVMDVLLASNITIAVIMLLTTVYVRTPLEFSIFPSLVVR